MQQPLVRTADTSELHDAAMDTAVELFINVGWWVLSVGLAPPCGEMSPPTTTTFHFGAIFWAGTAMVRDY